jgi:type I restriction enzyme, S subunit
LDVEPEVTSLPEDDVTPAWEPSRLGDLCSLRKELVEPSGSGLHRYVGLEHLDSGFARLRRWGMDSGLRSTKSRFRAGDVLYGKLRPYLDKAALAEWDGICSTDILVLEPKSRADAAFLSFLLHSRGFLTHAAAATSGVNHPRTDWRSIAAYEQPIPKLPEQHAIAGVLATLQAAVALQDQIVTTLKELKAATMAKLFREGLRGEELKQTEIGEIPESWEVALLGDLCRSPRGSIQTGPYGSQLHASDYVAEGVPIVNPTHLREDRIEPSGIPKVAESDVARLASHRLRSGDVVFSRRGDVGLHAYVSTSEEGWLCGTGCLLVRSGEAKVDALFLSFYLGTAFPQDYLRGHAVGTIMPNINTKILAAVPVTLPELDEQREIARVLDGVGLRIQQAEERATKVRVLLETVLEALVTGRLRVPESTRV